MAAIKLTAFTGEQPRTIPRLMPATAARSAIDVRLTDGGLRPFRQPVDTFAFPSPPEGGYQSIIKFGSDWLGFESLVHAALGPVDTDRLYYTGDGAPKMRVGSTDYDLAIPRPATALTATSDGAGTGDAQSRAYVFTYVTSLGEESEPSDASTAIDVLPGDTVTLSGFETVPTGRLITKQRIYRTQTGNQGTGLYFIAERTAGTGDFTDDIAVDEFAELISSTDWNAPPDDLSGLIALPNGMMAAFVGRKLYFCEPWRPHAWPEKYILTTTVDIVALGAVGTTVLMLTKGQPYIASGTTPDSMAMDKVEDNLPCLNAAGVVDLGYAIAWPSNDGLALFRGGVPGIVSGNIFDPADWRLLNPGTMAGGQLHGRWVGSFNGLDRQGNNITGSLIIDVSGSSAFLIRSATTARAWYYDIADSYLYFLDDDGGKVRQFDPATGDPASMYWRSKEFILPSPDNFGCILIETGEGYSADELAARAAEIAAVEAANAVLIAAGSILGDVELEPIQHGALRR